jgi:hypothetical protein
MQEQVKTMSDMINGMHAAAHATQHLQLPGPPPASSSSSSGPQQQLRARPSMQMQAQGTFPKASMSTGASILGPGDYSTEVAENNRLPQRAFNFPSVSQNNQIFRYSPIELTTPIAPPGGD